MHPHPQHECKQKHKCWEAPPDRLRDIRDAGSARGDQAGGHDLPCHLKPAQQAEVVPAPHAHPVCDVVEALLEQCCAANAAGPLTDSNTPKCLMRVTAMSTNTTPVSASGPTRAG